MGPSGSGKSSNNIMGVLITQQMVHTILITSYSLEGDELATKKLIVFNFHLLTQQCS